MFHFECNSEIICRALRPREQASSRRSECGMNERTERAPSKWQEALRGVLSLRSE